MTGLQKTDDGWTVQVEVVEVRRIPDTTDVLALYEVETDSHGACWVTGESGGTPGEPRGTTEMTETPRSPATSRPYRSSLEQSPTSSGPAAANLADILERVLDKGIIIAGDIKVNLLDIELLTIKIRLLIVSVDKAQEMGIDWWRNDPMLNTGARSSRTRTRSYGSGWRRWSRARETGSPR